MNVVPKSVPASKVITDDDVKLLPLTVKVKLGPPESTLVGLIEVRVGDCVLLMLKDTGDDNVERPEGL